MAYDLSSPFPVELRGPMTPDENPEDYATSIKQNTDFLNQNFTEQNNAILSLMERMKALEEGK